MAVPESRSVTASGRGPPGQRTQPVAGKKTLVPAASSLSGFFWAAGNVFTWRASSLVFVSAPSGWFLPLSLLLGNHPWTTLFLETVLGGPKIIPNRRQECLFKEKRNLGSREESSFLSRRSRDRQQVTLFPSVPPPPPSSFPFEKERWEKMMEVGYEWWNLNDFLSRFLVSTT